MSIWQQVFGAIKGGWKTYGPASTSQSGAWDSSSDPIYDSVTADKALKLSACWGCMNIRSETVGTLPVHLRDKKKNIVTDHPSYDVLHSSPNAMQTAAEYWSMNTAHEDMHGNAISIVTRRKDKSVISLEPVDPCFVTAEQTKSGAWVYRIGSEEYAAEDILHLRGFSMRGFWGLPRLDVGRWILSSQLSANESAMRAFKQGLKVGGFFQVEQNLDKPQLKDFKERLDTYGKSENIGKWMTLMKGMTPIGGAKFAIKPADAELLQSRYFGIEEICRLFSVPPQLIGHSDKASSWASSLENINLFFVMYSLMPTIIRNEQRINKILLTPQDRAAGIQCNFNIQGLMRADLATQMAFFQSALQNGYLNPNEVRDLLDRGNIPDGDKYRVQLNMGPLTPTPVGAKP